MRAADIMTTDVLTIGADKTVKDAAEAMLAHGVSALPVVDAKGKLVGIVSEGDLMRRAEIGTERRPSWWLELLKGNRELAEDYVKAHGRKVEDVMTRRLVTAKPETPLADIAALLEKNAVKRVPVVARGKPVGIVSRANLLQALAGAKAPAAGRGAAKDADIRRKVTEIVKAAPWRPWLFNATARDGVVALWGIVGSAAEKKAAGLAAEGVAGVKRVENNLIVRPNNWAQAARHLKDRG